jgi:hypothetical protein
MNGSPGRCTTRRQPAGSGGRMPRATPSSRCGSTRPSWTRRWPRSTPGSPHSRPDGGRRSTRRPAPSDACSASPRRSCPPTSTRSTAGWRPSGPPTVPCTRPPSRGTWRGRSSILRLPRPLPAGRLRRASVRPRLPWPRRCGRFRPVPPPGSWSRPSASSRQASGRHTGSPGDCANACWLPGSAPGPGVIALVPAGPRGGPADGRQLT